MKKRNNRVKILIGPVIFAAVSLLLPSSVFTTQAAKCAVACLAWMAYWWIAMPVDLVVTALLPIAVNAIFNVCPAGSITSQYASDSVLLILGASIVATSFSQSGLERRIACSFLKLAGNSLRKQVVFWFLLSALMSTILANIAVAAALTPIAYSVLCLSGEGDIKTSVSGQYILMAIAWGAGLGGLATPLGGAMNLVVVEYIEAVTKTEYMYFDWVIRFLPIMAVLLVSNILYLWLTVPKSMTLSDETSHIADQYKGNPMNKVEIKCLSVFLITVVLAFARPLYSSLIPGLKPAYLFMTAAIVVFFVREDDDSHLLTWNFVEKTVNWGILYIFAGGLAVAKMLTESKADVMIGEVIQRSGINNVYLLLFIFVTATLILSDITSNTATAAVSLPIVVAMTQSLELNPLPFIYAATIGINLSYSMPTATRAIPVGYGMPPKFMFDKGVKLSGIVIVLMTGLCVLLYKFWPLFLTA